MTLLIIDMKILFSTLCCLLLLHGHAALAARIEEPYSVEIPVSSQSPADRTEAMRSGLTLLLARLSGQQVDADPLVKKAVSKAENYVQQFSYVQAPAIPPALSSVWRIKLGFSPPMVNQLLADAGVALWPLDRPRVLMMMVNEQGAFLPLPSTDNIDVTAPLLAKAEMRGIPLALLAQAEQDLVLAVHVQQLDASALTAQMQQAKADALLIGNVRGSDAVGWNGQWVLRFKEQDQIFQQKSATFDGLVNEVLRQTAAYLSGLYISSAVVDTGPAQLRLQIDGVKTYPAYMQLRQYLEKTEAVQRLGSMQINGTTVVVDVDVKGKESFRNLISLFNSLQWQEEIAPPAGSEPSLRPVWRYQWVQ